ncbi:hypothetical protein EJ04DRAFT_432905 [Polyplosphaeria fusca]|uniref:Tat pathway signal sequence protein n=1 Tax=Polyplosphaeria fusca TaxID=682080 RepID=A0A9P4V1P3_9PLEO|nr:hypothetical protein EJ04DRAFT_432905 [Polyplosphaeria fusca]
MYVLNSSAYTSLGLQTAELIDQPGNYLITLEVFHQLHCLDYIRLAAYASHNHKHTHHEGESEWSKEKHLSHCVDYLRQVLMCHGDLTPISLVRRDGVAKGEPPYRPDFSIRHTCRRWEKIWEFAERGNTSGFGVA